MNKKNKFFLFFKPYHIYTTQKICFFCSFIAKSLTNEENCSKMILYNTSNILLGVQNSIPTAMR